MKKIWTVLVQLFPAVLVFSMVVGFSSEPVLVEIPERLDLNEIL